MRSSYLDNFFCFACLILLLVFLASCASPTIGSGSGLYSSYNKEVPYSLSGDAKKLVSKHGPPDEFASVGDRSVLIWRGGHSSYSMWDKIFTGIQFFGIDRKTSIGAVVGNEGETLAIGKSKGTNEATSILSVYSMPVHITD